MKRLIRNLIVSALLCLSTLGTQAAVPVVTITQSGTAREAGVQNGQYQAAQSANVVVQRSISTGTLRVNIGVSGTATLILGDPIDGCGDYTIGGLSGSSAQDCRGVCSFPGGVYCFTYSTTPFYLDFAEGEATKTITITPVEDFICGENENVIVSIAGGTGYTVGSPPSQTVNIQDLLNQTGAYPCYLSGSCGSCANSATAPTKIQESTGSPPVPSEISFQVIRTCGHPNTLQYTAYLRVRGTAVPQQDYNFLDSSGGLLSAGGPIPDENCRDEWILPVTIPASSSCVSVRIRTIPDSLKEGNESIIVDGDLGCRIDVPVIVTFWIEDVPPPAGCAAIGAASLVSWWPGDRHGLDWLGVNNNHASLEGVVFRPGVRSYAFSFESFFIQPWMGLPERAKYAIVPAHSSLNVGASPNGFTVEFWIKPTELERYMPFSAEQNIVVWDAGGVRVSILHDGYTAPPNSVPKGRVVADVVDNLGNSHIVTATSGSGTIVENVFYHVALTYNGNQAVLYVNGSVSAQSTLGSLTPLTTGNLLFGFATTFSGGTFAGSFQGLLDEVSLYNAALSSLDVLDLYLAHGASKCYLPPLPQPIRLTSLWKGEGNGNDALQRNNIPAGNISGVTFTSGGQGRVGEAFSFSGPGYAKVPASSSLNVGVADEFTVELWIKPTDLAWRPLVEWNSGVNPNPYGVHLWLSTVGPLGCGNGGGAGSLHANIVDVNGASHHIASAPSLFVANEWQHVALTYHKASGVARLYRNGNIIQQCTVGTFTPRTAYDLWLGYRPLGVGQGTSFSGKMDEVSVYGRTLSQQEIQSIYGAEAGGKSAAPCSGAAAPSGLVSVWAGEGSGSDAFGANHGVLVGDLQFTAGKVGQAILFASPDPSWEPYFVQVPASPGLNVGISGALTIEGWINPTDPSILYQPLLEWNDGSGSVPGIGLHFYLSVDPLPNGDGGAGTLFANLVDTSGVSHPIASPSAAGLVTANTWHHVALTYDKNVNGGTARLYLNKVMVKQITSFGAFTPQTSANYGLGIGVRPGWGMNYLGYMDEMSLYNRALSASEIGLIFDAGQNGKCY